MSCFVGSLRLGDRRTLRSLRNHDIAELEDARAATHARNPRFTRRDYLVHPNWSDLIKVYQDAWILECPFCHVGEG
jgi:hypothetical protein